MTTSKAGFDVTSLQRLNARDMLIVTDTADEFLANMTQYLTADATQSEVMEVASREKLEMAYGYDSSRDRDDRKPFVYSDGVAVIPVHGSLINRFNSSWGFATGYNYIRRMMNLALDDDDVDLIVFDIDSPGGEASGNFELAREIMASRRVKPSLAMVDALAASGGMAIAAAATTMYAIPSARVGSIGVYRMHVSYEDALKSEGIKVTFAQAGAHKTDGNPYKDLPQSVLDEWTESVGKTWDDFIDLVAEARDIPAETVRNTQARVYRADEALALGLIDAVKTTTEAVAAFVAELGNDEPEDEGDEDMENTGKNKGGSEVTSAVDYDKIGTMIATAVAGAVGGLTRSQAIKDYGAKHGQVALATKLAANAAISEEDAISMIDDAVAAATPPKAKAKGKAKGAKIDDAAGGDDDEDEDEDAEDDDEDEDEEEQARSSRRNKDKVRGGRGQDNVNHLDKAMKGSRQPNVGAGGERRKANDDSDDPADQANSLLSDHAAVTGSEWSKKAVKSA